MLGAAARVEDTDSSRAHGLITDFRGSTYTYVYCDTLLLVQ